MTDTLPKLIFCKLLKIFKTEKTMTDIDYGDFNIKADNKWVYKVVQSSEVVSNIMADIKTEIPELIKQSGAKAVRHSITKYICNPTPFKNYSLQTSRLIKILKRHLIGAKCIKEEGVNEFASFERVANNLRQKVRNTVKKLNISENFEELLGCSADELIEHLENQFVDGMTWDNHGVKGWHIDHIKPLCSFVLTDPEQVRQATHYTNLRPLWAKANITKASQDRKLSVRKKKSSNPPKTDTSNKDSLNV